MYKRSVWFFMVLVVFCWVANILPNGSIARAKPLGEPRDVCFTRSEVAKLLKMKARCRQKDAVCTRKLQTLREQEQTLCKRQVEQNQAELALCIRQKADIVTRPPIVLPWLLVGVVALGGVAVGFGVGWGGERAYPECEVAMKIPKASFSRSKAIEEKAKIIEDAFEERSFFRKLFWALPHPLMITDTEGNVLYAQRACRSVVPGGVGRRIPSLGRAVRSL